MTTDSIPYKVAPQQPLSSMHYYEESPFKGSPWFHPEVVYKPRGVVGEPLPYVVSRDNVITGTLLLCFVIAAVSVAFSRDFILRHLHNFFYVPRSEAEVVETGNEIRFQLFLCLQSSLLLAIVFYLYVRYTGGEQPMMDSQVLPIAAFTFVNVAYLVVKWGIYQVVNLTFFDKRSIGQWERQRLFFTSSEGVLLFPVILVQIYCGLPLVVTLIYALFIVILVKILTFYKAKTIFFKENADFMQNILYFCALELMPLGALWGILNIVQHYLKVNF